MRGTVQILGEETTTSTSVQRSQHPGTRQSSAAPHFASNSRRLISLGESNKAMEVIRDPFMRRFQREITCLPRILFLEKVASRESRANRSENSGIDGSLQH